MNSLQNLIQRLSAIGQVTEAEEKCSECGCTPCECDDKEKVEEGKGKKPDFLDADNDGNKKEPMSDALADKEVKESALDLLRRHSGIQEAAPVNFDKVLDAVAALYGDDMWHNDSMQDVAHDLEQQNPTDQELDFIIARGRLPQRLANTQFTNNDSVKFGEGAMDTLKAMGKKALDTLGHPDDEDLIKDMQKKAGLPQTGKKPGQEEEVKETALNLLRRYSGIAENNNEATVDEALNTSKLADTMGVDVQQLRMAVSRASTGKQTRSDIMLLSDTFVKLLNNPDDTVIQTVANLIKSGNTAPAPEANMKQEGNEFSGALKAAKDAGAEEFEVGGKKYKVNECSDMSPMSSVPNGESHMGIPAEIMARMSSPEMSEPEGPHMEVPMAAEAPKATYTLSIQNGENNLQMTTDVPDEIIHIMKLAGVNKGAEVTKKEMPADGEQEVEESGYENTPDNTKARDPQAHGDIRDWGQKGTANAGTHYTPAQSGDNPMNEQRMFQDYKNFKAGK